MTKCSHIIYCLIGCATCCCEGGARRRAGSRTSSEGDPLPPVAGPPREAPGVPEPAAYGELVPPLRWLDTPGIANPGSLFDNTKTVQVVHAKTVQVVHAKIVQVVHEKRGGWGHLTQTGW